MKCVKRKECGKPVMLFRIVFVTDAMMQLLGHDRGSPINHDWKVTKTLIGRNKKEVLKDWKSIRNTREDWWT